MILTAYRHGLRNSEVCDLQWHQVELSAGCLHVRTAKNVSTQCRAPAYARCGVSNATGGIPANFLLRTRWPYDRQVLWDAVHALGERARMPFAVFPHMLRHACGYTLANAAHDTRVTGLARPQEHPAHGAL